MTYKCSLFKKCPFQTRKVFKNTKPLIQFVIFKPLSYCFEETIGFGVQVSFARRPVSCLIKLVDITKKF